MTEFQLRDLSEIKMTEFRINSDLFRIRNWILNKIPRNYRIWILNSDDTTWIFIGCDTMFTVNRQIKKRKLYIMFNSNQLNLFPLFFFYHPTP